MMICGRIDAHSNKFRFSLVLWRNHMYNGNMVWRTEYDFCV